MSLEAVLEESNSLLRELIALWKTGAAPAPAPAAAAPSPAPAPAKTEAKAEAQAPAPATQEQAKAVTYDDIKPLIIKLGAKSRDSLVALLGEFKVARGPDLKPEQYGPFHAKITELLA